MNVFQVLSSANRSRSGRLAVEALLAAALLAAAVVARGQMSPVAAAGPEINEAGVPPFFILEPEALGMSSAPVDLQPLPDGRLVALGNHELAFGDGSARWQVFHQVDDQIRTNTERLAVAEDGRLYAGIPGGFGRIDFGTDGKWSLVPVAGLPPLSGTGNATPLGVAALGGEWFWWWGGGTVISWHPGVPARVVGQAAVPNNRIGTVDLYSPLIMGRARLVRRRSAIHPRVADHEQWRDQWGADAWQTVHD